MYQTTALILGSAPTMLKVPRFIMTARTSLNATMAKSVWRIETPIIHLPIQCFMSFPYGCPRPRASDGALNSSVGPLPTAFR